MKSTETANYTAGSGEKRIQGRVNVRAMTVTAMLSALSFILMYIEIPVPFMPPFIKLDLSDLPALIASFAFGPVSGVCVCLIKNLLHLPFSSTGGVGELSNFILSAIFVLPAGLIYSVKKSRRSALIGALTGAVVMAVSSLATNYFIVYPVYYNFMPKEAILNAYQAIYSGVDSIFDCLLVFNVPFTFAKALISVIIVFPSYKYLSPLLKGRSGKRSAK